MIMGRVDWLKMLVDGLLYGSAIVSVFKQVEVGLAVIEDQFSAKGKNRR